MKKIFVFAISLFLTIGTLSAFDTTAFQLSIFAPRVQLVPPEIAISGLKLNLPYGSNSNITGFDLGLVSINREQDGEIGAATSACQINLVNISNGDFSGLQVGLYNEEETASGLQFGVINNMGGVVRGFQFGLLNTTLDFRGLQVGLVNYTDFLTGVQIGLVNIATRSSLPFFPIVNMCF